MRRKALVLLLIVLFVISTLPSAMVWASSKYEKSGHISATFRTVYGGKELKVDVDYRIWIPYGESDSWNTSWPFQYWYRVTSTCDGQTKTYEDEDDFAGFERSRIEIPVVDCEYEKRSSKNSPAIHDRFDNAALYVDMVPFWGGSDPGFKAWAKSFWGSVKVYLGVDERIGLEYFSNLTLSDLKIPKSDNYKSSIYYSIITPDGKRFYGSSGGEHYYFWYSYYNSYSDQGDFLHQGQILSDGKKIYTVILPQAEYRKDYDTVGYVYTKDLSVEDYVRLPYDGRTFVPYEDMKEYIKGLLYGRLGDKYGEIKVIKKSGWKKMDDGSYARVVMVEYPAIPPNASLVSYAYSYYYAWDKYEPSLMKFYVVGAQAKHVYEEDGKQVESLDDYYHTVWGERYSELLDKALKLSDVFDIYSKSYISDFEPSLPAIDRALFGDFHYRPYGGDLLHLRYASRAFRYRWLADWFYDAATSEAEAPDLPGHAYLEVKLGDKHIKALREGKDVSKDVDVPAQVVNGRMLVPVRHISEPLGAQVGWDGKERKVTISLNGHTIEMWIDNPVGRVDGKEYRMPSNIPPMIINNRTMVPLRFVAEALGAEVQWDFYYKKAIIKYLPDKMPEQ